MPSTEGAGGGGARVSSVCMCESVPVVRVWAPNYIKSVIYSLTVFVTVSVFVTPSVFKLARVPHVAVCTTENTQRTR
jgi:hypothetical protein